MKTWEIDELGHITIGEMLDHGGWIVETLPSPDGENIYDLYEILMDGSEPKVVNTFYGGWRALKAAVETGQALIGDKNEKT